MSVIDKITLRGTPVITGKAESYTRGSAVVIRAPNHRGLRHRQCHRTLCHPQAAYSVCFELRSSADQLMSMQFQQKFQMTPNRMSLTTITHMQRYKSLLCAIVCVMHKQTSAMILTQTTDFFIAMMRVRDMC